MQWYGHDGPNGSLMQSKPIHQYAIPLTQNSKFESNYDTFLFITVCNDMK